ncbi:lysophospholipid acyltransferase [Tubulinosema ratisbonensis]|uniref:Lysophospholipid acyltransferase n=1 Tax=Tubulinosema ratisbonensis TaxID=291195 RepID=A0A437AL74_9MICR|nr:lysophospholipid acyltransferase [Tubulinosema ratisbonensis]
MKFTSFLNKANLLTTVVLYCSLYPPIIVVCILAEWCTTGSRLRKELVKILKSYWSHITFAFFSFYLKNNITIVYNKKFLKPRRSLVISNHVSNYDWIVLIKIFYFFEKFYELSIILKKELEKLPIVGRGMKMFNYIFLKRDLKSDEEVIKRNMVKLQNEKEFYLLLFPEGTILCESTHKLSEKWAETTQFNFNFENVLIPRKTGFNLIINSLFDKIDNLTDITIFNIPKTKYIHDTLSVENLFIKKNVKFNFLFLIDVYEKNEEMKQEDFIYKIFDRKNEVLKKYHNSNLEFIDFLVQERLVNNEYEIIDINFTGLITYFIYFVVIFSLSVLFYYSYSILLSCKI